MPFLPVDKSAIKSPLDIIIISGDAYVDHPSFGSALIARYLESHGFSVGIIAQPDYKAEKDFLKLGKPRLFFGVSAGNLDSMVSNFTADKKIRRTDMYSPDNEGGRRPNRASIVYTNKIKALFPGVPVVLGGVEASLRRFAHYDYWDNKIRRSLIFDAKADYLVYGMGEVAILRLAECHRLKIKQQIPNVAIIVKDVSSYKDALILPSFEEVAADKKKYAQAFKLYYTEGRKRRPRIIIQPCQGRYLVVFPPANISQKEFDGVFTLPFMRAPHPMYKNKKIPAWDFVKFSTVAHRGCCGGCSFCAISQHHGKYIVSRSINSIKKEIAEKIIPQADFRGVILDVGGPTSNMYGIECAKDEGCTRASCVYPTVCKYLEHAQKPALKLLKEIRRMPGVKKLLIGSGIRYDLALFDDEYMNELIKHHVGGHLSVAPEHFCDEVLAVMGKPSFKMFISFKDKFKKLSRKYGKKQFIVPYFIASHPGTTLKHALALALYLKKNKIKIEQVQNFTPTPMTPATCMYYTGLNPFSGKAVHIPRGEERSFQRALLQPQLKNNYRQVVKALKQLKAEKYIKRLID